MNPSSAVEEEILERFQSFLHHAAGAHAPAFLDVDVTMPQAKVLYLVSSRPGMPMSTIAAELGVGLPAVSGLIDRLATLGYVERREDPVDRRQQLVTATEAASAALDRLRELNTEAMRRLITGLTPDERVALLTSLTALDREVQHADVLSARVDAPPERKHS